MMMNWVIESIAGEFLQLRVTGPRDGLVTDGVPQILPLNSGVGPIACEVLVSPDPDLYSVVMIEYDGPLLSADAFVMEQPSSALRNKWGGQLASSVQAFPVPGVTPNTINMNLVSWAGSDLIFELVGPFPPHCIGSGVTVENVTQSAVSSPAGWAGDNVLFTFGIVHNPGDEIVWLEQTEKVKGQWGGTMVAGSTILS
jgi:hypothetical protein